MQTSFVNSFLLTHMCCAYIHEPLFLLTSMQFSLVFSCLRFCANRACSCESLCELLNTDQPRGILHFWKFSRGCWGFTGLKDIYEQILQCGNHFSTFGRVHGGFTGFTGMVYGPKKSSFFAFFAKKKCTSDTIRTSYFQIGSFHEKGTFAGWHAPHIFHFLQTFFTISKLSSEPRRSWSILVILAWFFTLCECLWPLCLHYGRFWYPRFYTRRIYKKNIHLSHRSFV